MSEYLIRVELHYENDYTSFHSAMAKRGCERTIKDVNTGVVYDLPTGTYYTKTSISRTAVVALVQAAVTEVGCTASIVVATATGITWSGLKKHEMSLGEMLFAMNR